LRTLILGLGNPILSDDAAGLQAARQLYELVGGEDIDLVEAAVAGMQTVQLLSGYDRAVIIDVMQDEARVGEVWRLDSDELENVSSTSSHGIGVGQALRLARLMGLPVPEQILIYAIAAADTSTFGESLTPELRQALPAIVRRIAADLAGPSSQG
jgi:hydrogenase maturation protease